MTVSNETPLAAAALSDPPLLELRNDLRQWFLYAIFAGISWAVLGGLQPDMLGVTPTTWVTLNFLVPIILMGIYTFSAVTQRQADQRLREEFADSLYYLGFIFTLLSLVAALLLKTLMVGAITANDILGQFGVALVTTAAGLIGRTYLLQFRPESDALSAVDEATQDAGSRLATRMREFAADLDTLRDEYSQTLGKLRATTIGELETVRARSTEEIKASAAAQTQAVQDMATEALNNVRELTKSSVATVTTLERALKGLVINGEAIEKRIDAAFVPLHARVIALANELEGSLGALRDAGEPWQRVGGAITQSADGLERLARSSAAAGELQQRVEELGRVVASVSGAFSGAGVATDAAAQQVVAAANSLAPAAAGMRTGTEEIGALLVRLRAEMEAFSTMTGHLQTSIVEGANFLARGLEAPVRGPAE